MTFKGILDWYLCPKASIFQPVILTKAFYDALLASSRCFKNRKLNVDCEHCAGLFNTNVCPKNVVSSYFAVVFKMWSIWMSTECFVLNLKTNKSQRTLQRQKQRRKRKKNTITCCFGTVQNLLKVKIQSVRQENNDLLICSELNLLSSTRRHLRMWGKYVTHTRTHYLFYFFPHPRVLRERINLWEQLNHITLCKYLSQPPLSLTTALARNPMAPLAQTCAWGKLTFALAVCKWQLVLAIEMKRTPMQEGEWENIWAGGINNSSGRAVTFAFRVSGLTECVSVGSFESKIVFFISILIFHGAFRSITGHLN